MEDELKGWVYECDTILGGVVCEVYYKIEGGRAKIKYVKKEIH